MGSRISWLAYRVFCISISNLGEYLDIHCGGVDNIFPHHTNEIAQSEAYLGHKWCNYWVHGEHLNVATGKMSKSEGNFLTLTSIIEKGYDPLAYRYLCLTSHYRKQLVFSEEILDNATQSYQKLKSRVSSLSKEGEILADKYNEFDNKFKEAISEDLNTANALTLVYELLKSDTNDLTKYELIKSWDKVLSLDLTKEKEVDSDLIKYIESKIEERNEAKANKDYTLSDQIRDELLSKGIILKDTREGTSYEIK